MLNNVAINILQILNRCNKPFTSTDLGLKIYGRDNNPRQISAKISRAASVLAEKGFVKKERLPTINMYDYRITDAGKEYLAKQGVQNDK